MISVVEDAEAWIYLIKLCIEWVPAFIKTLGVVGTDGNEYVDSLLKAHIPLAWHRLDCIHLMRNIEQTFSKYYLILFVFNRIVLGTELQPLGPFFGPPCSQTRKSSWSPSWIQLKLPTKQFMYSSRL